jgi:hypothetical protein
MENRNNVVFPGLLLHDGYKHSKNKAVINLNKFKRYTTDKILH